MSKPNSSANTEADLQIKSCPETVGSEACVRCVKNKSCPSGFTDLEEIQEAEGRNCCKGQS